MNLSHLTKLTDGVGLLEHCLGDEPRQGHGYCVDDVARAHIVLHRARASNQVVDDHLIAVYENFLAQSQATDGQVTNRRSIDGEWRGTPSTQDHWGRALWAWGTAVRESGDANRAAAAYERFRVSARRRSVHLRSMVFAALGAAQVLEVLPGNEPATSLLRDAVALLPPVPDGQWVWPEARLTYANAAIPEMLMLAGFHLNDSQLMRQGRYALNWLWQLQSSGERLSLVSHRGWLPGDPFPAFDQQPIEVSALVDACVTAYHMTSDPIWHERVLIGRRWFDGLNDQGIEMHDPTTGAGFDALTADGRNNNRGAESTISFLSVEQRSASLLEGVA